MHACHVYDLQSIDMPRDAQEVLVYPTSMQLSVYQPEDINRACQGVSIPDEYRVTSLQPIYVLLQLLMYVFELTSQFLSQRSLHGKTISLIVT